MFSSQEYPFKLGKRLLFSLISFSISTSCDHILAASESTSPPVIHLPHPSGKEKDLNSPLRSKVIYDLMDAKMKKKHAELSEEHQKTIVAIFASWFLFSQPGNVHISPRKMKTHAQKDEVKEEYSDEQIIQFLKEHKEIHTAYTTRLDRLIMGLWYLQHEPSKHKAEIRKIFEELIEFDAFAAGFLGPAYHDVFKEDIINFDF